MNQEKRNQQVFYWLLPILWKGSLIGLLGANAIIGYKILDTFSPQPPVHVNASSIIIRDKVIDGKRVVTETYFAPSINHESLQIHSKELARDLVNTLFSNRADENQVRIRLSRIQNSVHISKKNHVYEKFKKLAITKAANKIETEFKITKNNPYYDKSRKRILTVIEGVYLEKNKLTKNITSVKKKIAFSFASAQEIDPSAATSLLMDEMETKNISKLSKTEFEGEQL